MQALSKQQRHKHHCNGKKLHQGCHAKDQPTSASRLLRAVKSPHRPKCQQPRESRHDPACYTPPSSEERRASEKQRRHQPQKAMRREQAPRTDNGKEVGEELRHVCWT